MRAAEKWLIAILSIFCISILSHFYYQSTPLKHLDSVFLFESTKSILDSGLPLSKAVITWADILKTFTIPIETLCRMPLNRSSIGPYNVYENHAYTILYPISALTALTGPELAFAILNAISHFLMLLLPFIFLRKMGRSVFSSFVFAFGVAVYPAWSFSSIGDYYLDRFYMPFALLTLYLLYGFTNRDFENSPHKTKYLILLIVSILGASLCTERGTIMMMAGTSFFLVANSAQITNRPFRISAFSILVVLAIYLYCYFNFFHIGLEGGGGLVRNLLQGVLNPLERLRAPGMVPFITVNILFLGFLIPFAGIKYFLLAAGAMAPNLLVSIGGAELNGWSTHYHAMYIPFYIFVASIGFLKLTQRFLVRFNTTIISAGFLAYFILLGAVMNPYTGKQEEPIFTSQKLAIFGKLYRYYLDTENSGEWHSIHQAKNLEMSIPPGSKVSTVEGGMPTLYKSRNISLYPIDIDNVDYIVVSGSMTKGKITYLSGATSYLGEKQAEALNRCLLNRMTENRFELLKDLPVLGLLIFKKEKRP